MERHIFKKLWNWNVVSWCLCGSWPIVRATSFWDPTRMWLVCVCVSQALIIERAQRLEADGGIDVGGQSRWKWRGKEAKEKEMKINRQQKCGRTRGDCRAYILARWQWPSNNGGIPKLPVAFILPRPQHQMNKRYIERSSKSSCRHCSIHPGVIETASQHKSFSQFRTHRRIHFYIIIILFDYYFLANCCNAVLTHCNKPGRVQWSPFC